MLTWYTLPSIFALALKLTIFWFGRRSLTTASIWLWIFFVGLFGMNLIELIGFYYVKYAPDKGLLELRLYYIFAELMLVSLCALSLENAGKLTTPIRNTLILFFIICAAPLIIPGAAITGFKNIGYSITRIPGPYYFIVQLGILLPLLGSIIASVYYSFNAKTYSEKRKSQILFIACSPFLVSIIIIMVLMQTGVKINAAVILSLMINITLLILIYTEHKENQYKFMSIIPRTREHEFIKKLSHIVTDPTIGLKRGRELIEKEMIYEALISTEGNKIKAAKLLGISRQTLHRRLDQ